MTTAAPALAAQWQEANLEFLRAAAGEVRALLLEWLRGRGVSGLPLAPPPDEIRAAVRSARAAMPAPPALERMAEAFSLTPFEQSVLLACVALEIDPLFASLVRTATGGEAAMTFLLAIDVLPGAHWSALTPDGPLRHWQLVQVGAGPALTSGTLRIDERVLHELVGSPHLDSRLACLASVVEPVPLGELFEEAADDVRRTWADQPPNGRLAVLTGAESGVRAAVAAEACRAAGLGLYALPAALLPPAPEEAHLLARLWEREAAFGRLALLVELGDAEDPPKTPGWQCFVEAVKSPLVISAPTPPRGLARPHGCVAAPPLDPALLEAAGGTAAELLRPAWQQACRRASTALEELAQRIRPMARWEDLVLPAEQLDLLRQVVAQVRNRRKVYADWGFAARASRGLGITAMFSGPSGTGKTMAAEILAAELGLELFRIDLSQVTSKYIGETEKNLKRVFDAAERCGAVLLFDEADALFGQRSEVRDSHDRYANLEVSYLLQRMESYSGLAILTTNRRESLDPAFLRRLRYGIDFPFPGLAERREIWRRIFPAGTPLEPLDYARLARMELTGGLIRNVALNAAFLAAEEQCALAHRHLSRAARAEYAKLELPFDDVLQGAI